MAVNRELTNAEKEILQSNVKFIDQCTWAIKNFASYHTEDASIGAQVGAEGYIGFFKNRIFSLDVMQSGVGDALGNAKQFAAFTKGMQLWDNAVAPFDTDVVVTYMIANNKFDEIMVKYGKLKTAAIVFSIQ